MNTKVITGVAPKTNKTQPKPKRSVRAVRRQIRQISNRRLNIPLSAKIYNDAKDKKPHTNSANITTQYKIKSSNSKNGRWLDINTCLSQFIDDDGLGLAPTATNLGPETATRKIREPVFLVLGGVGLAARFRFL